MSGTQDWQNVEINTITLYGVHVMMKASRIAKMVLVTYTEKENKKKRERDMKLNKR